MIIIEDQTRLGIAFDDQGVVIRKQYSYQIGYFDAHKISDEEIKNLSEEKIIEYLNICVDFIRRVPIEIQTKNIVWFVLKKEIRELKYLNPEYISRQNYIDIVSFIDWLFMYVPKKYIDQDFCLQIFNNNSIKNLYNIPDKFKTKQMCLEAVKYSHMNLEYIPKKFMTKKLCEIGLNHTGYALKFIPEKYKTRKICDLAIMKKGCPEYILYYIPEKFKTRKFWYKHVFRNSRLFKHMPKKYQARDICIHTINRNWRNLQHIEKPTQTMINLAIEKSNHKNIIKMFDPNKFPKSFKMAVKKFL